MTESRRISTPAAPAAIGPYSQAVVADGWLFGSGQIALDPQTGRMAGGDDVAAQTEQVLRNVAAVLAAAGGTLGDVVKTTVYIRDIGRFAQMNEVYERHFGAAKPARATVEVSRLPRDAVVEIDFIARLGSA